MDNFIRDGIYMEGDILAGDVRCEQRPSSDYQFINGEWRFDFQEVTTQVLDLARTLRAPIFSILDGRQVSALVLGDIGLAEAIEDLKVGLRNITSVNLSAVKDRAQALKVVVDAYKILAAAAPASIKADFLEVLTKAQKI